MILTVTNKREKKVPKTLELSMEKENKNKGLLGYQVNARNEIKDYDHDGIMIISYSFLDNIKERLEETDYPLE